MPQLNQAITKVNESLNKGPQKRRPYLDNIVNAPAKKEQQPTSRPSPSEIRQGSSQDSHKDTHEEVPKKQPLKQDPTPRPKEILSKPSFELPTESASRKETKKEISHPKKDKTKTKPWSHAPRANQTSRPSVNSQIDSTPYVLKQEPPVLTQSTCNTDEEDGFHIDEFSIDEYGKNTIDVLFYLFNDAKMNKTFVTSALRKPKVALQLGIPFNSLRTVLERLSKWKIIKLEKSKGGKTGWTKYSIRPSVYDYLLYYEGEAHRPSTQTTQTSFTPQNRGGVMDTMMDSLIRIPDNLTKLGFNHAVIGQLKRANIESSVIQESLDAFGFDMQDSEFAKKVRTPLPLFMKVVKTEGLYLSSRGYVSPEDEILSQMVELKKQKLDNKRKKEAELLDLNFQEWLASQSEEYIYEIVPPTGAFLGSIHLSELKDYFQKNIFQN